MEQILLEIVASKSLKWFLVWSNCSSQNSKMSTKIESSVSSAIKFEDINADEKPEITEVESLCMNCESQVSSNLFEPFYPFR